VTLIPTTIGGLLSAIGIAGMDRLVRLNVIAKSGRAVEAAGDVHTLLLDKTGTITFGNRRCSPACRPGVTAKELAEGALLASLADDTAEGKSIVEYLRQLHDFDEPLRASTGRAFSAETRLSGVDFSSTATARAPSMRCWPSSAATPKCLAGPEDRPERRHAVAGVRRRRLLGAIHLKDVVKPGIRERFAELRKLGIRTVMVTGDNPLTAAPLPPKRAMTCWPKPRRRRNWRASARSRTTAAWWPCAATAPTTRRRWPRLTSAWR
jgi:K+-transporting ATPase ATPase B chain